MFGLLPFWLLLHLLTSDILFVGHTRKKLEMLNF